ncbi:MAG: hypothetical protein RLZZ618_754 [Pseudomonadota bacterium]|jgi:hypothetical protein
MKEYRLRSWPELAAPFTSTAYRRMLSDMSHRYMSMAQLVTSSGVRRQDVRQFLDSLDSRGLLNERELFVSDTLLDSIRPLGNWIRRKFNVTHGSR